MTLLRIKGVAPDFGAGYLHRMPCASPVYYRTKAVGIRDAGFGRNEDG